MKVNVPEGYQQVIPYLVVVQPQQLIDFTQQVFDATLRSSHMRDGEIAHAEIMIGDTCIMMGKSNEQWEPMTAGLFIYVADADASFKKATDAGATIVMELSDQSYGRTCGVKDPSGNTWWITSVQQ